MKINYFAFCLLLAAIFFGYSSFVLASETRLQVKIKPPVEEKSGKPIPRIDDEAAETVREAVSEGDVLTAGKKDAYSQNFWVFLFGVYFFLMMFNLTSDFGKRKKLQWFWVSVFTFLAIYAWDNLDASRNNDWFPAAVMESGMIIYGFYLYYRLLPKSE